MKLKKFNEILEKEIEKQHYEKISIFYNSLECGYEENFYISTVENEVTYI